MTEEITFLESTPALTLNEVHSITSIDAHGETFACEVTITDRDGFTFDTTHMYRASDPHGLSPILKQWVLDNPDFLIADYVEPPAPTAEEIRAKMPWITPRQLRLTLVRSGIPLTSVSDAIDALSNGLAKEEAKIEWEYATTFQRNSPTLMVIADALYMTPEAVDALWTQAMAV